MVAVVTMVDAVFVFASLIAKGYCRKCRPRLGVWARKHRGGLLNVVGRPHNLRAARVRRLLWRLRDGRDEHGGEHEH